ncbi:regulatory protein [Microbacterium sp. HM58-2]|nr:regulatory protein [Microbacterium sp. HM58-2]
MVSLGDLVRAAGSSLRPLLPFDPAREVSGVHVSELADPGRYLDGGELLLSTGLPLTGSEADTAYVSRLAAQGAGALGIGLGEGWTDVPPGLADRCEAAGLPLFSVPDGARFLDVSRAFWSAEGRSEHDTALRTGHAHTRLAEAAGGSDPIAAVTRLIAQEIGGWAAWIPFDAAAPRAVLHPPSLAGLLPVVTSDARHSLARSGVAAASFVSHGSTVIAHAVTRGQDAVGALALGAGRPLTRADRQLALTATALLRLCLPSDSAGDPSRWITTLILEGRADAARALGRSAGVAVPGTVRVLVDPEGAGRAASALAASYDGEPVRLAPSGAEAALTRGAIGIPVALEAVPAALSRLLTLRRTPGAPALVVESATRGDDGVRALREADPALLDTVRAYLRHGRSAERTARELGVHRNTVRPRIAAAEAVLGASLDDPDASAELWIAIRAAG